MPFLLKNSLRDSVGFITQSLFLVLCIDVDTVSSGSPVGLGPGGETCTVQQRNRAYVICNARVVKASESSGIFFTAHKLLSILMDTPDCA